MKAITFDTFGGPEVLHVVDALGDGVTGVAVGDHVFGWADQPTGSYAEYASPPPTHGSPTAWTSRLR